MDQEVSGLLIISIKVTVRPGDISLEHQIGKFHGACVRRERALPILSHIESVKGRLGPDVLEGDIGHVAGASRICLDESDIVALDDGNVASMLLIVSVSLLEGPKSRG